MLFVYRVSGFNAVVGAGAQRHSRLRRPRLLRRHAHAARHRRHRPDDRHGGRRQRADLRAHQGGAAGGQAAESAIDAGFGNALSSIVDANITTLIAALFLFQFGTGPVRGFAVTLSIGILGTLFCGIFVSRWLFDLVFFRTAARGGKLSI